MPTAQSTGELERTRQEAVAMKSKIRSVSCNRARIFDDSSYFS